MLKKGAPISSRLPQLTYHSLIFWVFSLQLLLHLVGARALVKDLSFSAISIVFSWTYLRFLYKSPDGVVGDQSEDFLFVNMFPAVLLPIAIPLTTAFYNLVALTGVFPSIEVEKKSSQHHLRFSAYNIVSKLFVAYIKSTIIYNTGRMTAQRVLQILSCSLPDSRTSSRSGGELRLRR
jgi:hypothetical protein